MTGAASPLAPQDFLDEDGEQLGEAGSNRQADGEVEEEDGAGGPGVPGGAQRDDVFEEGLAREDAEASDEDVSGGADALAGLRQRRRRDAQEGLRRGAEVDHERHGGQ